MLGSVVWAYLHFCIPFVHAINEPYPKAEVPALGVYEVYTEPERFESVQPAFAKPDTPWAVDYWGASRGFKSTWDDPGSSENVPSKKEYGSRSFWNAKEYPFEEVDLEAFAEQAFNNYTPYAVGTLPYAVKWHQMMVTAGVYQFKLGQWNDGSQKVNLRERPQSTLAKGNPPLKENLEELKTLNKQMDVIMVSKGGKVIAVFPVMQTKDVPEGFSKVTAVLRHENPRHPQRGKLGWVDTLKARVDETEGRPITRFNLDERTGEVTIGVCQKHLCYMSFLPSRDLFPHVEAKMVSPYQALKPSPPQIMPPTRWDLPAHLQKHP